MRVALVLRAGGGRDVLEANVAFHLHAGLDVVVVWVATADQSARTALERLDTSARVVIAPDVEAASAAAVSRWAAEEHDADWLIEADWNEFWWPRAGSPHDAFGAVPPGCNGAQAVVRTFLPTIADEHFEERFTLRLSPRAPAVDPAWRPLRRFAVRSDAVGANPSDLETPWGYYPFEVLRLAAGDDGAAPADETQRAIDLHVVTPDERLRDVVRSLRAVPPEAGAFQASIGERLSFPTPNPGDDADFALEAAVLGDLDLVLVRGRLDDLSQRLGALEGSRRSRTDGALRRIALSVKRRLVASRGGR